MEREGGREGEIRSEGGKEKKSFSCQVTSCLSLAWISRSRTMYPSTTMYPQMVHVFASAEPCVFGGIGTNFQINILFCVVAMQVAALVSDECTKQDF